MTSILEKIVRTKQEEIAAARRAIPLDSLRSHAETAEVPRDFFAALNRPGPIRLIAEFKRASPSQGRIRGDVGPVEVAQAYASAGAACVSVLTDHSFFEGTLDDLRAVRAHIDLPLLRKDFIVDSYQIVEARAAGADAVLLIAECLDDCHLRKFHNEIVEWGMTPLIELYDPANLPRVLEAGATLIGINNRDLHTFVVTLEHTLRLRAQIPEECVLVSESGIQTRADVLRLQDAGVDAILVGEHLMRQTDIAGGVRALLGTTS